MHVIVHYSEMQQQHKKPEMQNILKVKLCRHNSPQTKQLVIITLPSKQPTVFLLKTQQDR